VAGLDNLAASRLLRRVFGRCRATQPASRAARMAPTPAFADPKAFRCRKCRIYPRGYRWANVRAAMQIVFYRKHGAMLWCSGV